MMLRNKASGKNDQSPGRMKGQRAGCPCRTILAAAVSLLLCTGAGNVVTDTMPACASGWQPALPGSPGPKAWRYDVEVGVDAMLVVRTAGGRIVAVLPQGRSAGLDVPGRAEGARPVLVRFWPAHKQGSYGQ